MTAAINEAVKDIPYPVDEEEVISISHEFTGSGISDETYTYTMDGSIIEVIAMKSFSFTIEVKGNEAPQYSSLGRYTVEIKLPSGGKYIVLDDNYSFYTGGDAVISISARKPNSDSMIEGKFEKSHSRSLRLARLS